MCPEEHSSAQDARGKRFATVPSLAKTLLLFPAVSRQSFCKFMTSSGLANNLKLKGKGRVSSSSHLGKLKYLCSGMYSLRFICCGYLTLGGSCVSQGVKSKEKAAFPHTLDPPLAAHVSSSPSPVCSVLHSHSSLLTQLISLLDQKHLPQ